MTQQTIFFVGTQDEIAHHAAPMMKSGLADRYRVLIATPNEVQQQAKPADLAVFYSEHFDRFRQCCQELKKRNVATLYMVDGIIEWRNAWENCEREPACPFTMRPVLSHKVACIGPSQARILCSWGNANKVELIGVPRFDEMIDPRPAEAKPDEFRVLVMTAKCPGFTEEQKQVTIQSLNALKAWFSTNTIWHGKKIVPVWRLTQNLATVIGVENQLLDLTGSDLKDALARVHAVISTPSTAILEAMLMKRPVALLDFHNVPKYIASAWEINVASQIPSVVSQIMTPTPARLHYQQSILHDSLVTGGSSTVRLKQLMDQMLVTAISQLKAKKRIAFEPNLMEPEITPAVWEQAEIFPNRTEFQESNLLELQSQLAHSRREIEHLQCEMQQLQAELTEAHGIFDQIHDHPIAGPIVRARQKVLNWMTATRRWLSKNRDHSVPDSSSSNQPAK